MNTNSFSQQSAGISPALLNTFQNPHQAQQKPFSGTLNPSLLINGAGPVQQHGGSINPAALHQQQPQLAFNLSHLLHTFNMSREHFQSLSQQERQKLGQHYINFVNSQNQAQLAQPLVGSQVPFERPSSAASNHSSHQNSMLHPVPRPPTAQGTAQISRPGTSLSHRSPTIPGSAPSSLSAAMERPQTGLQGQNHPSQPLPQQTPFSSNLNSQSIPGIPNMGINNMNMTGMMMNNMGNIGVPSSPRIGGSSTAPGAMGPPGLPRSLSSDGMNMGAGMVNMGGSGLMTGGINMNIGNIGAAGNMSGMGMGMNGPMHRPQSSMGMSGGVGGIVSSTGMGLPSGLNHNASGLGMNMVGMNVDPSSRSGPISQASTAPQTPMRQGSLPPSQAPSTLQQGMGSISMHTMGGVQPIRQNVNVNTSNGGTGLTSQPVSTRRLSVPPTGIVSNINPSVNIGGNGVGMGPGLVGPPNVGPTPSPIVETVGNGIAIGTPPQHQISSQSSLNAASNIAHTATMVPGITNSISSSSSTIAPTSSPSGPTSQSIGTSQPPTLNPSTTHITNVPLLNSEQHIRSLSPSEIANVRTWMNVDQDYDRRMRTMKAEMSEEMRNTFKPALSVPFGQPPDTWLSTAAPNWWERGGWGSTGSNWSRFRRPGRENFDVKYSGKRDAALRSSYKGSRKGSGREGLKLPRKIDHDEANKSEVLVPIRIEFDVDHHKMREAFIWNLNDPVVTPEIFAQSLVDDYNLSSNYHNIISKSIHEQLTDFHGQAFGLSDNESHDIRTDIYEENSGRLNGVMNESESQWWAKWRKRVKQEARRAVEEADTLKGKGRRRKSRVSKREGTRNGEVPKRRKISAEVKREEKDTDADIFADNELDSDCDTTKGASDGDGDEWKLLCLEEIKVDDLNMREDMRILIKLDIIVASVKLDDQFEWDLDNSTASPEEFAEVYTQELGLGGEFKTAISHSIREQVYAFQKSLLLLGHPSEVGGDDDIKQSLLPGLTSGARPVGEVSMFTPLLNYLSDGEIERTEKEKDKEMTKRRKRNTRGRRGIVLPDREPIRTYRTPAIGFPELDAATLALQAAANAPTSRRAAAAAATLTIASIVTSENRDDNAPFMPQPIPISTRPPVSSAPSQTPLSQLQQQHQQKGKGFFKAPPYPPTVLRPRAHVNAPTPSTAADSLYFPAGSSLDKDVQESQLTAQDSRLNKLVSAKRAKELEREAKEKEFVDGQHPNYINGVWHCSNCGCPESIAVGRRKGPLGDKSQCGTCGKFWHRHRRPRPVEYNSDPSFHSGLKLKEVETLKTPANKKRGAAALRSTAGATATPPPHVGVTEVSESRTPVSRQNGEGKDDDDRAISPVSTVSSESEAPLAHKVKVNGYHQKALTPPATPQKYDAMKSMTGTTTPASAEEKTGSLSMSTSTSIMVSATPSSPLKTYPPQWLTSQMHLMQARYPNDRFEVILRKVSASSTPEWRIKCLDCPGKLYTPGPLETLSNYEVHLKNRQHRQRVNDRLANASSLGVVSSNVGGEPPSS